MSIEPYKGIASIYEEIRPSLFVKANYYLAQITGIISTLQTG